MQVPNERYLQPRPGGSAFSALLYGELKRQGVKFYELVAETGISDSAMRKYFQFPETAPLGRLIAICKRLGISKSVFCQTIEWRATQ